MMIDSDPDRLAPALVAHLEKIYSAGDVESLCPRLVSLISAENLRQGRTGDRLWNEKDIVLISYADSIVAKTCRPLEQLRRFVCDNLSGFVSTVHVLPFFPYSSDDGFAVIDYLNVNPSLGDWGDIEQLGGSFDLMFDLVVNHVSSQHVWFRNFLDGADPGRGYFITPPGDADLTRVTRPRSSSLLTAVPTVDGEQLVWTTFSADQVDADFSNPDVLCEYVSILLAYLRHGARFIRLDAIAFLWKEWGTTCLNLPQTHEMVRLFRTITSFVNPDTVLLTETNVPHLQNVSYFGDSDEAHMVYQFSLAPLLLHSLYRGNSHYLTEWARTCCLTPPNCTFLNFTASHDGIGMRPLEGLLPQGEIDLLLRGMESFGGRVSYRSHGDGEKSVYEINITYFDALKGTWIGQDSWQLARFMLAQTLMLGLRGIPALYIHSLLATENDIEAVEESGRARMINRHRWDADELDRRLADETTNQALVLNELKRRIAIRRQQPAFHPDARQEILFLGEHLFGFWRQSLDGRQKILAVHNLTDTERILYLDAALDGQLPGRWVGLLTGEAVSSGQAMIKLPPYHVLWLAQA